MRLKKLFSFLLSFLLFFQGNAPFLSAFAQEATESTPSAEIVVAPTEAPQNEEGTPSAELTPEPTPELASTPTPISVPSLWTFEKVELGKEYTSPQNSEVKLTFTLLPNPAGNIKIEEVTLTKEQIQQTGSLSEKAYDITSDMIDGSFSYNLSLPIPESSRGKTVEVKSAEDLSRIGSAEKVENTLTKTDTSVSVENLDHFTIFVVTNPSPPPANYLQDIVDNSDPGFEIVSGTWYTSTTVSGYYGSNYITTDNHTGVGQVRWNFTPTQTGTQEIFTRWTAAANHGTAVPFTVSHDGGSSTVAVNEEQNNGSWMSLGTYSFTANGSYSVTLTNNSSSTSDFVVGDAIKLQNVSDPLEVWVDNNWAGTSVGTDLGSGRIFSYSAFSAIPDAVDGVATGGTVHIADSAVVYADPVVITKSGLTISCNSNVNTIINTGNSNTGIALQAGADNVSIQNCLFTGNGDGISLDSVSGTTIQNNVITANAFATSGIYILDSSSISITSNTISNNVTGVDLDGSTSGITLSGNTFTVNSSYDISNNTANPVAATGNSWGTTNFAEIESRVYHSVDNPSLSTVDFGSPTNGLTGVSNYVTANFSGISSLTSSDRKLVISDTDSDATFAIAQYSGDPPSGGITIATPFGSYYEIQYFGSPAWPVNLKLYYAPADLASAGITENQLLGLYYNSGTSWNIYSDDGQSTTGVDTTSDYLWANAHHFTPIVAAADTTSPSAPGTPSTIPDPTKSTSQTWNWTAATDDLSGILGYWYRSPEAGIDSTSIGNVLSWPTNFSIEGLYNFYVLAEDIAGNKGLESNGTVTVDTTPPDSATLIINSDANYTNSRDITLTISASDVLSSVAEMRFSNGGVYSTWEPYATSAPWTLANSGGTKNVYAEFKDAAGNANSSYLAKDTIILDRIIPVISDVSINNLTTNNNNYVRDGDTVNLTATITDTYQADITTNLITADLTGLGGGDADTPDTYDPSTGLATWANLAVSGSGDGLITVTIDAQDAANNSANQATDDIQADNTPPQAVSAETQDLNSNGRLDAIKLTFNENINDSYLNIGSPDSWDVAGAGAEQITTGEFTNDNILLLTFGEGPTPDTANTPTVTYTPTGGTSTHDTAGNELAYYSTASTDSAPPVLLSAVTRDTNSDRRLDSLDLTFSENIDDSRLNSGTADGWDVDGYDGESITTGNSANDNALILGFTALGSNDTGALPKVSYIPLSEERSTHDFAGNQLAAVTRDPADGASPEVAWTTPAANSTISGTTPLAVDAKDNDKTGIKSTQFQYRADAEEGFHDIAGSSWDTTPLALGKYILRAVVTDNADNTTIADEAVYVAAVISNIYGHTVDTAHIEILWNTDRPTDGRIIYNTVSHSSIDPAASPNYGYANSTGTEHAAPDYGTSHGIVVGGLSSNTVYYWRIVSAGTPVAVSGEYTTRTYSEASAGGGGGGGGGGAVVNVPVPPPPAPAAVLGVATKEEEVEEEVLPTPTPQPSPTPQVQGAATFNFNWWLVIIPVALLGLIISGLLLWRRT